MTTIHDIARGVGLSAYDVQNILARGPRRYKTYDIPKRSGGWRTISQPSRELKAIQRYLCANFYAGLKVTKYATAYRPGISIRENALAHSQNSFLLKLDFSAFFHSFRPADLDYLLALNELELPRDQLLNLKLASFWKPKGSPFFMLAMGAPTSPALTNAAMYLIDTQIAAVCDAASVTFTRYADDITLSGNDRQALLKVEALVKDVVSTAEHPKLRFNDEKRGLYGPGQKRIVTGLVLTPTGEVSIGRERKRLISAGVNWWIEGKIESELHAEQLRGLLAFANSAEPDFMVRLCKKYGTDVIQRLLGKDRSRFWSPGDLPWSQEDFFRD